MDKAFTWSYRFPPQYESKKTSRDRTNQSVQNIVTGRSELLISRASALTSQLVFWWPWARWAYATSRSILRDSSTSITPHTTPIPPSSKKLKMPASGRLPLLRVKAMRHNNLGRPIPGHLEKKTRHGRSQSLSKLEARASESET